MTSDLFPDAGSANFDDPLAMLSACHRRIERQLATLARLERHLPEHGSDADARAAARAILRYFDTAAPHHHADEEESLFPRLRAAAPGAAEPIVAFLESDHVVLEERWRNLRPLLAGIAAGTRANLSPRDVEAIRSAYEAHIAREEGELIPLAAQALDATAIAAIGGAPRRATDRAAAAMTTRRAFFAVALAAVAFAVALPARAQDASPYAIDIPKWFSETFLDFREDIADAAKEGRRVMAYFGQDGCPYCTQLMVTNFSQKDIVEKTRRHFVAVALNIWGDRETTWLDGKVRSEKALARFLDVQFTPTLLFFDEKGKVVARLNGYYPPHRFDAVLDYVAQKKERDESLAAYLARRLPDPASATLADEAYYVKAPYDLAHRQGGKPLAVLFETPYCAACDELHRETLKRAEVAGELARFDVARFGLGARTDLTAPDGARVKADAWARDLGIAYTPTIVLFDANGREAFRVEAYMRPFHLTSAFEYVASGAYATEPSFQRFVQARAERLRTQGETIDLWR
jgi:thioredoxin-related protein/hemerythrin-like domain-containing protein